MMTPQAIKDIERFYAVYNPDRISMVPMIAQDAAKRGLASASVFRSLYNKYAIKPKAGRFVALVTLRREFDSVDNEVLLSVLRRCEFEREHDGQPIDVAARALLVSMGHDPRVQPQSQSQPRQTTIEGTPQRQVFNTQSSLSPTSTGYAASLRTTPAERAPNGQLLSPAPPVYGSSLRAADTEGTLTAERVVEEEVREWAQRMVQPYLAAKGLHEGDYPLFDPNVRLCDGLRDGGVLWMLQRVLSNPHMDARQLADLPVPKTSGFYGRDNVCQFISFVKRSVMTSASQHSSLFTDADLCDAKGDRAVVNCLLLVSKMGAQRRMFNPKLLPSIVLYEQEIDEQEREEEAAASPPSSPQCSPERASPEVSRPSQQPSPPHHRVILSPPVDNRHNVVDMMALIECQRSAEFDRQRLFVHEAEARKRLHTHIRTRLSILGESLVAARNVAASPQAPRGATSAVRDIGQASPLPHRRAPNTASTLGPQQHPATPLRAYRPPVTAPAPSLDDKVRMAVSNVAGRKKGASADFYRWKHTGEYVVYHRITKKRTVVHVREVRNQLMIRVGGGWDLFPDWLARHVFIDTM